MSKRERDVHDRQPGFKLMLEANFLSIYLISIYLSGTNYLTIYLSILYEGLAWKMF